ncbi:hypothetical protein O3P69_008846 [Scylla paramamosain]|uniref:Uncharacterized protein n=1 Tax=Scylla paramamosain TaxID=85552 RepID=A0AAW0TPW2_SCYPA
MHGRRLAKMLQTTEYCKPGYKKRHQEPRGRERVASVRTKTPFPRVTSRAREGATCAVAEKPDVNDNCDGSSRGSTCDPRQAAAATLPRPLRERFTVTQHAKMDEKAMHFLMVMNRMWKSDGGSGRAHTSSGNYAIAASTAASASPAGHIPAVTDKTQLLYVMKLRMEKISAQFDCSHRDRMAGDQKDKVGGGESRGGTLPIFGRSGACRCTPLYAARPASRVG